MGTGKQQAKFIIKCAEGDKRVTLEHPEGAIGKFQSLEEALDFLENSNKGATVIALSPTGKTIFETTV